jgi:anti-sigma factor RsiW
MSSCSDIRPLLSHTAESEVTPEEAMRVARHLSDCTACKIVLARERRLAEMLEEDLVDLPVGDEFVESVMAVLPDDPPPRRGEQRGRRGLRLAGFAGILGVSVLTASRWITFGGTGGTTIQTPAFDFESLPGSLEGLFGLIRLALIALESMVRIPLDIGMSLSGGMALAPVAAAVAMIALGGCSGFLALAARSLARPTR